LEAQVFKASLNPGGMFGASHRHKTCLRIAAQLDGEGAEEFGIIFSVIP
jgi:hypothetical protein